MPAIAQQVIDDVLHIRFGRPEKLNAFTHEMFDELKVIVDAIPESAGTAYGAVVLSGEGTSFCAGLDFTVHQTFASSGGAIFADPDDPDSTGRSTGRGQGIVRGLRECAVPVIAALHGHAIGAGMQFALGADIRIATPDVKLGLAEMNWGLTVDMGGSQLLPPLVGSDRALDLLLSGRLIPGTEAYQIGMVTRLSDDPVREATDVAREIAAKNRRAVLGTKKLVALSETDRAEGFLTEQRLMHQNIGSPEQSAAATRYFEAMNRRK